MIKRLVLFVLLTMTGIAGSATRTNVNRLLQISQQKTFEFQREKQYAIRFAEQRKLPVRFETENAVAELMRIENGMPVYYITDNVNAAATSRADHLWPGGSLGFSLDGTGYTKLGEWDGGAIRLTHQEFNNTGSLRVTQEDGATTTHYHSVHVAGTLIAGGVDANAKGMAYNAQLKAYEWNDDSAEMRSAAASGMEISNHSYGSIRGWYYNDSESTWYWYGWTPGSETEDSQFGLYDSGAADWDDIAFDAPYYLIVKSAGNDRSDTGPGAGGSHKVWDPNLSSWVLSTTTREQDGGADGYDCIGNESTAKNILTVGAVDDVTDYTGPASVVMSSFSCWGPIDDGRIKPDIVANGVSLYSCLDGSDTDYGTLSGTSMASPSAAGTLVLLQQHYQNLHSGAPMRAATLKALVIHTADEAGDYTGPDYKFGWGLLNADAAARKISEDANDQNVIDELTLSNGGVWTRNVTLSGNSPLRATIVWTDPAGTALSADLLNPTTPALVNDLDIRVVDPSSGVHYPYTLDLNNPANAATFAENNVDNVEMVYVAAPGAGTYTITVDHDGTLSGGSQDFSLILSGIDEYTQTPGAVTLSSPANSATGVSLSPTLQWNAADRADHYTLYVGTDGGGVTRPTNLVNGAVTADLSYALSNLAGNTTYYWQVVPANNQGDGTASAIWSFTTITIVASFPYTENFDSVTPPTLPDGWTKESGGKPWDTDSSYPRSGPNCARSFSGYVGAADDWLLSLPLSLQAGKIYSVQYWYRGYPNASYDETLHSYWGSGQNSSSMTKLLATYDHFTNSPYREALVRIAPAETANYYLGVHAGSGANGAAIYVDDVYISDATPATLSTADDPGNALDFDGVDDYVSVGAVDSIRTIELWLKPALSSDVILQLATGQYLQLSSGALDLVGVAGEAVFVNGEPSVNVSAATWSHVAVVLPSTISGSDVRLGAGNGDFLQGVVDEFRIWKTARTQTQIQDNAHNTVPTDNADLYVYFKCDHTSGATATDMTSNVINDGALTSMTDADWIASDAPCGETGVQVHGTGSGNASSVGATGKQMQATLSDDAGDSATNYLGIYSSGAGDQQISDATLPGGISQRANIIWGVEEFGAVTAELIFSYGNLPGTDNPSQLALLKRSGVGASWNDVTSSASHNSTAKTFTLSGLQSFSEFAIGYGTPIAVQLISFDAAIAGDGIKISWQMAEEINQAGYNILRSDSKNGVYKKINKSLVFAQGQGVTTTNYEYLDAPENIAPFFYKLDGLSMDGRHEYFGPVEAHFLSGVEEQGAPKVFALRHNYPNPFNPTTTIRYDLAGAVPVSLILYDVTGRLVRILVDEKQSAGRYSIVWNGRDESGMPAASGIYFLSFKTGDFRFKRKITLMR